MAFHKHAASDNHVYRVELVKHDGKRVMRLFGGLTASENKDNAQRWADDRQADGTTTIKRLKVNTD